MHVWLLLIFFVSWEDILPAPPLLNNISDRRSKDIFFVFIHPFPREGGAQIYFFIALKILHTWKPTSHARQEFSSKRVSARSAPRS
jgi:hypothetical protein